MFSTTHLDNVNSLNPYQPSGSNSDAQADPTYQPKRMGPFLMIQFVTFVPTLFVLHIIWFVFDRGWVLGIEKPVIYLSKTPSMFGWMAAFTVGAWLPPALLAVVSRRIRSVSPVLNGIVGGALVAIELTFISVILIVRPETSNLIRRLLNVLLLVSPSLIAVVILSRFQSKTPVTPLSQTDTTLQTPTRTQSK